MTTLRTEPEELGADDERVDRVEIDAIDMRLPCRAFAVSYKVAEQGKLSLTMEFVLRLLHAADGLMEDAVGEFFGFSGEESLFAINQTVAYGFVDRRGGRVYLTDAGRSLFSAGSDEPALFEVRSRQDRVDVDLIAFAPAEARRHLDAFEFKLPDLPVASAEAVGKASQHARHSFTKHFHEFRRRYAGAGELTTLYTIDDVRAERRYAAVIPVKVSVRPDNPAVPEADLLSWKTGFELEDRAAILQACANYIRNLTTSETAGEPIAAFLEACAPAQVGRFIRNGQANWPSFFRTTVRQAGKLQADRPTVRVVGRIWVKANKARLAAAAQRAADAGGRRPQMMLWLRPNTSHWGMTTEVGEILNAVRRAFSDLEADPGPVQDMPAVLIGTAVQDQFTHLFDGVVRVPQRHLPVGAEILLVPGRFAFVLAETSMGTAEGFPVPLGIVTVDPEAIRKVHGFLTDVISSGGVTVTHCAWQTDDALVDIDRALEDFGVGLASPQPKGPDDGSSDATPNG
jgi:hypothetical protein